ncbi:MAG: aminotransferase class IV [Candidatus Omnitrophica bacterium]|nr:aminotransferase class IV [Candidatus Omnitrophota bacterium]
MREPSPALLNGQGPLPSHWGSNGCFETMRAYHGRIFRLEQHLDRLEASARFLGTPPPPPRRQLAAQLLEALARSGLREAVVRVALIPPQGRRSARGSQPSIVVQPIQAPPPSAYRRGIRVAVVPARPPRIGAISPQAKYSARLGSVLAVQEAQLRGVDEALFMAAEGFVTESTASNLGVIRDGALETPPCSLGLLSGITRDVLFEVAAGLQVPVREVPLTRYELYTADEVFLSSTLKEALPVTWIDGRRIGTGRPGPVTQRLGRAFRRLVERELGMGRR